MKETSVVAALMLAATLGLAGCHDARTPASQGNHASVLGGSGPTQPPEPGALTDAQGQPIPEPHLPANTLAQLVRAGDDTALAVWVQDGHVVASSYARATGWTPAQPLEQIYGQASEPQLASNGHGIAMAVWRHTVGSIQSLRFSRFQAGAGWSTPDVLPGALPRPPMAGPAGAQDLPRLQMDAQGNVVAQWPSGFHAGEVQEARYVEGQGWTRAVSEKTASATTASPARPAPSSAR